MWRSRPRRRSGALGGLHDAGHPRGRLGLLPLPSGSRELAELAAAVFTSALLPGRAEEALGGRALVLVDRTLERRGRQRHANRDRRQTRLDRRLAEHHATVEFL